MSALVQSPAFATSESLAKSRDFCRDVTRRQARNFYYGLKLLPEPKRSAMYALYAYMRLVDDIADDETDGRTIATRKADLDHWETLTRQAFAAAEGHADVPAGQPLWPAFVDMLKHYHIPAQFFHDMIAGQRQDLEPVAIPDFAALHQYCYRVASVVGVASLYIFGFDGSPETLALGVDRGIAFQLTNILRDLREDAARNRCYIPAAELAAHHISAEELAAGKSTPAFANLMSEQITRAQSYYDKSASLESRIQPDARPTLSAMTAIYHGILKKIAANPTRVLEGRVRLSAWSKLQIAWRAMNSNRA